MAASTRQNVISKQEWREGWMLVLASSLGAALPVVYILSVSVAMKPLQEEFGWSRAEITSIAAIKSTVLLFASPFVGYCVDKWGPRRIALPGIFTYCGLIGLAGFTGPNIWSWYIDWTFAAIAGTLVGSTVWTAAVASRFVKSRGLALGFTMAGQGLVGAIVPPLAVWALGAFGWRGIYFVVASVTFAVIFPITWLFFFEGSHPKRQAIKPVSAEPINGYTFRQALRSSRYWRLMLALCIAAGPMGVFALHLFSMMTDSGFPPMRVAGYVALVGPLTVIGRIGGGFLMDRFNPTRVTAVFLALPMIGCLLIPHIGAAPDLAIVVVVATGLATGAESDALTILTVRYFGLRAYGQIYAVMAAAFAIGYGYSGALAGKMFDTFGNYNLLLGILAGGLCFSIMLILTLGPEPEFSAPSKAGVVGEIKSETVGLPS